MTAFSAPEQTVTTSDDRVLHAAVAAYLGRYRPQSRLHTGSDLKIFLIWCADQGLDPLRVGRTDIERYVRWLQEVRFYQPSTVSRRLSVVVGFYRVCVIDQILPYSPADYVRRPPVPAESPALGLGLRIFEACGANIDSLGEEHGHRVLKIRGKGDKTVLIPLPPAVARAIDRAVDGRDHGPILRNFHGMRMDRHAATRRLKLLADGAGIRIARMHPHMLRHTFVTTMLDAGVSLRDVQIAARHAPADHDALRPGPREPRPAPPTTSSLRTWPPERSGRRATLADERMSIDCPRSDSLGFCDAEPSEPRDLEAAGPAGR